MKEDAISRTIPVGITATEEKLLRRRAKAKAKTLSQHVRHELDLPPPRKPGRPKKVAAKPTKRPR